MEIQRVNLDFTVCKIVNIENVDFTREFVFLSKTDEEISLVCESDCVPSDAIVSETGWNALKISGILDFGMIGVISKISSLLAEAHISVFVISTYNTDYILLKSSDSNKGIQLLEKNGYTVR